MEARVTVRVTGRGRGRVGVGVRVRVRIGEWLDQFTWPRQAQYMVRSS